MKLLRLLVLLPLLLSTGCAYFHKGAPAATTIVKSDDSFALTAAIVEAFASHGYQHTRSYTDALVFDRPSSRTDEILYGNWNETISSERVTVRFTTTKPGTYRISCLPYTVRGEGLDDVSRRVGLFAGEYRTLLREIRRNLAQPPNSPEPFHTPASPTPTDSPAP